MDKSQELSVREMFQIQNSKRCTDVIKVYHGKHSKSSINVRPTKKSYYVNDFIRYQCSPGPANTANHQQSWISPTKIQLKKSQRKTYLDQVKRLAIKKHCPDPCCYSINLPWGQKTRPIKFVSDRTIFTDNAQYQSQKYPGPGEYSIRGFISISKLKKKWSPHSPLKPTQGYMAEVASYLPCPLEYTTFTKYALNKTKNNFHKKQISQKSLITNKQNSPAPNLYSTINFWPGKQKLKKNQTNYFKHLSSGPIKRIYQ